MKLIQSVLPFVRSGLVRSVLTFTLGLAVQVQAQSFLTNGLVAYYPFNGNANDASGSGNNGTVVGTVTASADRFGQPGNAYSFRQNAGYITVGSPHLPNGSGYTLSCWIRYTNGYYIIATGSDTPFGSSSYRLLLAINASTSSFVTGFRDVSNSLHTFEIPIPGGLSSLQRTWRTVAVSYDGNLLRVRALRSSGCQALIYQIIE
jgi:hypothetical protein